MPALDIFDSGEIDVLVTDAKLPARGDPHGSALARMIRNRGAHLPVILMSAHPELLAKDITSPAVHCQPLEIAELCRAIRVRQTQ
jgi:CheY-like chemotaxis protein